MSHEENKVSDQIDGGLYHRLQDDFKKDVEMCIDLVERFIPKTIDIDNAKQLAMYELYHRLKNMKDAI